MHVKKLSCGCGISIPKLSYTFSSIISFTTRIKVNLKNPYLNYPYHTLLILSPKTQNSQIDK